jgi:predicted DNA-binding transcriptional regulator AlpA
MPAITTAPIDTPTPQLLLRPRQAAALLAISERSLWQLTAPRGPIRPVRAGRSVRYALTELQRWIDTQQEAAHE